jgi:hypothetical protein
MIRTMGDDPHDGGEGLELAVLALPAPIDLVAEAPAMDHLLRQGRLSRLKAEKDIGVRGPRHGAKAGRAGALLDLLFVRLLVDRDEAAAPANQFGDLTLACRGGGRRAGQQQRQDWSSGAHDSLSCLKKPL